MKVWRSYLSFLDTRPGRFVSWTAALVAAIMGGARDPRDIPYRWALKVCIPEEPMLRSGASRACICGRKLGC